MKLLLTALLITSFAAPLGFSEEEKCDKCKKDKKESTLIAGDCDKCKDKDKKKEEGTLAKDCDKCKDKDKKEEGTLA